MTRTKITGLQKKPYLWAMHGPSGTLHVNQSRSPQMLTMCLPGVSEKCHPFWHMLNQSTLNKIERKGSRRSSGL